MGAQPQERVQWGPCASPSTHSLGPNVCTASDCPSLCYPQAPWATCALHCIALTPPPPLFSPPLPYRLCGQHARRAALCQCGQGSRDASAGEGGQGYEVGCVRPLHQGKGQDCFHVRPWVTIRPIS